MSRITRQAMTLGGGVVLAGAIVLAQQPQKTPGGQMSMDDMMKQCREHCQAASTSVDQALNTVRDTKQSNDPAPMRAALDQVEKPLAEMKEHMSMCMNMMSMMEKMHGGMMGGRGQAGMMQRGQAQGQTGPLDIALTTQPSPPRSGENTFEVTVKDPAGKPIADADVSIDLVMPEMGTMPEMKQSIKLSRVREGVYGGKGQVPMAGRWETTIVVSRDGTQVGTKSLSLEAR